MNETNLNNDKVTTLRINVPILTTTHLMRSFSAPNLIQLNNSITSEQDTMSFDSENSLSSIISNVTRDDITCDSDCDSATFQNVLVKIDLDKSDLDSCVKEEFIHCDSDESISSQSQDLTLTLLDPINNIRITERSLYRSPCQLCHDNKVITIVCDDNNRNKTKSETNKSKNFVSSKVHNDNQFKQPTINLCVSCYEKSCHNIQLQQLERQQQEQIFNKMESNNKSQIQSKSNHNSQGSELENESVNVRVETNSEHQQQQQQQQKQHQIQQQLKNFNKLFGTQKINSSINRCQRFRRQIIDRRLRYAIFDRLKRIKVSDFLLYSLT